MREQAAGVEAVAELAAERSRSQVEAPPRVWMPISDV